MDKDILELKREVWEVKTEIKHLVDTVREMKKLNELVVKLMERQNSFSDRIVKLENDEIKELKGMIAMNSEKLRKLEDYKTMLVASATVIWAIVSFVINKIF